MNELRNACIPRAEKKSEFSRGVGYESWSSGMNRSSWTGVAPLPDEGVDVVFPEVVIHDPYVLEALPQGVAPHAMRNQ
jgi:hypothetical protein